MSYSLIDGSQIPEPEYTFSDIVMDLATNLAI